jgi:hypothetical protein
MIEYFAYIWVLGWLLTTACFVILKRNEFGAFQLVSRCLLSFLLWPFILFMGAYFKIRGEL